MKSAFATTLFPKQLPLDIAGVIATAPRERFLDFWNTWDRPARMAVVGDIAVALAEKLIAAHFTDPAVRGPARPDPSLGEIVKTDGVRAYFFPKPRCRTPAS
jgi:zinc protease